MSEAQAEVDREVRSRFNVRDSYLLPDGEYEYKVDYTPDSKAKFLDLSKAVSPLGLEAWLTGTRVECVLNLRKKEVPVQNKSRVMVVLALLTLLAILLFSLFEQEGDDLLAPSIPAYVAFFGFGISIVAVVGARYLGHLRGAMRAGTEPNSSYLIPGLPGFTGSFPTLGFISYQKVAALNRDRYFDTMVLGPIAILAASAILQVAGVFMSTEASIQLAACQSVNSFVQVCPTNPSIVQIAIGYVLGPLIGGTGQVSISPVGDAAAVGFLLAFIALLPMASFDGGHISSTLWGPGRARVATYLSVALLLALDTSEVLYWGVAIAVLLIGGRPLKLSFKDEVSGVSRSRVLIYLAVLIIAFLAIPIPHDIATLPLG